MRHFTTTATVPLCTASSAEKTTVLRSVAIALFLLAVILAGSAPAQTGSAPAQTCSPLPCWTPATQFPGTGAHKPLLLTDGTVMVQEGDG